MTTDGRILGVVTAVHKGFVFVHGDDGIDRFLHRTHVQRTSARGFDQLQQHDRVEFLHIDTPRGPRAIEARFVESRA